MPDFNNSFTGSWTELSARIQARDHVFLTYIVMVVTIIGFSMEDPARAFLAVTVGYISLAISLLLKHHDLLIGILAKYQHHLYIADRMNSNVPHWQDKELLRDVIAARRWRDYSQIIFFILAFIFSTWLSFSSLTCFWHYETFIFMISFICSCLSIISVLTTQKRREKSWSDNSVSDQQIDLF